MGDFFQGLFLLTFIGFLVMWGVKFVTKKAAGELYTENEKYQKVSKIKRYIGIACAIFLVLAAITKENKTEDKKQTTQIEQQANKAAEKAPEPAKPVQVATLHVTPDVFRQRYNEYLHSQGGEIGASGALDLAEPVIKSGSVNDAVAYANNDLNLALNETIDKNTGEIKEVFITSAIAGKDNKTIQASLMIALVSYNALIYAVDPNSNRDTVQKGLGLQENVGEWAKNTETKHNGIKYFKMVAKGIGLSFGASAQ